MMTIPESAKNMIWVEKYRPHKILDCILPNEIKKTFQDIVKSGDVQNLMLCGSAGCGKTTVAVALCEELGFDYLFINASESGNIDTLRTTLTDYASTVSLSGTKKVIILDESDNITPAAQAALRSFLEEYSGNCRFIFTCNFKHKIIEPLHSRCAVVEFKIPSKEKPKMAEEFLKRISFILTEEKIKFDKKVLIEIIVRYFPDFRRTINELQRYSVGGEIDSGILVKFNDLQIADLIESMKQKNFTNVRKWVGQNSDVDSSVLFRKIYDGMGSYLKKESIPQTILILAEYQYKMAFSSDHEICLAACMAEIMLNAEFQ